MQVTSMNSKRREVNWVYNFFLLIHSNSFLYDNYDNASSKEIREDRIANLIYIDLVTSCVYSSPQTTCLRISPSFKFFTTTKHSYTMGCPILCVLVFQESRDTTFLFLQGMSHLLCLSLSIIKRYHTFVLTRDVSPFLKV